MIKENIRNLSASWLASWANQTTRKGPRPRTSQKPPPRAVSTTGSVATSPPSLGAEGFINALPRVQAQRLGAPGRVHADGLQARGRGGAPQAADPAEALAQLLAPELEDLLHKAEERVQVPDLHGRLVADLQPDQGRVHPGDGLEGRGRQHHHQLGVGEYPDRDRGQAPAAGRGQALGD